MCSAMIRKFHETEVNDIQQSVLAELEYFPIYLKFYSMVDEMAEAVVSL
jgi:hypothetical protein